MKTVLEAAEIYASMGLRPVPLYGLGPNLKSCRCGDPRCLERNYGKHPVGDEWQKRATADPDAVRDRFRSHSGNIGIALLNELVLIDADGDEGMTEVKTLGDLPPTLTAQSGSHKGQHWIYKLGRDQDPKRITDSKLNGCKHVDIKIRGQFVCAPSIHRSGNHYQWINFTEPALLPDWLYEKLCKRERVAPEKVKAPANTADAAETEKRMRAWIASSATPGAVSGSGGHNQTMAVASKIAAHTELSRSAMWNLLVEYNGKCDPPWTERELQHKLDDAIRVGNGTRLEERPRSVSPTPPPDDVPPSEKAWVDACIWETSKRGSKLKKTIENAIVILQVDPLWAGKIRRDTFCNEIEVRDPPWTEHQRPGNAHPYWSDWDTRRLQAWFTRVRSLDLTISDLEGAIEIVADRHAYSSAKDWMLGLQWDGVPRLDKWLPTYLGTENNDYNRVVGRWWIISSVARIMEPGCKADHVLILEGSQGRGKSSALRALAGDQWFSDSSFDIGSKDAYLGLRGKIIVEMAELDSLKRSDADRAKAFFTSPVDTYRAPYMKRTASHPRQCVFAGTTNNSEMLKDETGNRRYWPVRCGAIDLVGLKADRAQIWAEAVEAYQEGAKWYPETDGERELCSRVQDEHHIHDAYEDFITEWLQNERIGKTTIAEVAKRALHMSPKDVNRGQQMQIAAALKRLGWVKKYDRHYGDGAQPVRHWCAPATEVETRLDREIQNQLAGLS